MGTRSDIIVQRTDGKFARVYCHWDGYLSHNGKLLVENYNSQELAEALIAPGDISALGKVVGEKHDFEYRAAFIEKYKKRGQKFGPPDYDKMNADPEYQRLAAMTLYYGRDRGETGTDVLEFASLEKATESDLNEYTYVWTDGAWHWWAGGAMKDLGESVAAKADETEDA